MTKCFNIESLRLWGQGVNIKWETVTCPSASDINHFVLGNIVAQLDCLKLQNFQKL